MGGILKRLFRDNRVAQRELSLEDAWERVVEHAAQALMAFDNCDQPDPKNVEDMAWLILDLDELLTWKRRRGRKSNPPSIRGEASGVWSCPASSQLRSAPGAAPQSP